MNCIVYMDDYSTKYLSDEHARQEVLKLSTDELLEFIENNSRRYIMIYKERGAVALEIDMAIVRKEMKYRKIALILKMESK